MWRSVWAAVDVDGRVRERVKLLGHLQYNATCVCVCGCVEYPSEQRLILMSASKIGLSLCGVWHMSYTTSLIITLIHNNGSSLKYHNVGMGHNHGDNPSFLKLFAQNMFYFIL